ncbi:hypothetical protein RF11_01352 [Thelohanellus kitauei]|uniref:Tc1-like transposase DDE domain-containing protein n=1 Tax=Thelohanellus kitauei TaxID=669202 RepID=A0A0C2JQY2_THEKT|nr:hypothetical protein RF11_01352 [Thelohanellus kitauei]
MNYMKVEIIAGMIRRAATATEISTDLKIYENSAASTKEEIQSQIQEKGIRRNVSSICKMILRDESFTMKRVPVNLDVRKNYCRIVSNISDDRILFKDDTQGRLSGSLNQPKKRVNISVLEAISLTGDVHYMMADGAINGELFIEFMMLLCQMTLNVSSVYVMDNALIHKLINVSLLLLSANMRLEFLPPYSLQFTPIEEYFYNLQNLIRQRKS